MATTTAASTASDMQHASKRSITCRDNNDKYRDMQREDLSLVKRMKLDEKEEEIENLKSNREIETLIDSMAPVCMTLSDSPNEEIATEIIEIGSGRNQSTKISIIQQPRSDQNHHHKQHPQQYQQQLQNPNKSRCPAHAMMEDYIDSVGRWMIPSPSSADNHNAGMVNPYFDGLERITALGYLTSPLRKRTVWEDWSPIEVALFEAGLMQHGKNFSKIANKYLGNKQTKDVVAFYYVWKKTNHYKEWKRQYIPDNHDDNLVDEGASVVETSEALTRLNGSSGKRK
jgi:hypothetical protein